MRLLELIKAILFGIVEGVSEWLPISSTGHMIILNELLPLDISAEFSEAFFVIIQLGAILAVPIMFRARLFPSGQTKREVFSLYSKLLVSCIPAGVLGFLFDELLDRYFYGYITVALALLIYGILFIALDRRGREVRFSDTRSLGYREFFLIGLFQSLSLIPGTSRSGVTMLGGISLGLDRATASEISFLLAIPVMLGASALKCAKLFISGYVPSGGELLVLLVGCVVAFLVSLITIRFLMDFVRRHTLVSFGIYRIVLSVVLILLFVLTKCK